MKNIILLSPLLWAFTAAGQPRLDAYVRKALSSNEAIRAQQFRLDKSLYALQEARALFLPSIGFNASYNIAEGGRKIDFPVGDLLNPVYRTLNQVTGGGHFPAVSNQSILLNPNNFYDARIRTTIPLLNAELEYNRKIKTRQYSLQQIELNLYRRELVKDVKNAYFSFLKAREAVLINQTALTLARENLRVNQSLLKNQKINRTAVTRSENEVSGYEAKLETAKMKQNNARAYFNFLLNTDLTAEIATDSITAPPADPAPADTGIARREELAKLKQSLAISQQVTALAKSYDRPKINAFADLGSQAFDFKVNNKSLYYLAGLSLDWNIFSGNKNKYKIRQAEADNRELNSQTSYTELQLQLQLTSSINSYKAALAEYRAAASQVASSQKYYLDLSRLYMEGQALFIELLDAQNQLIQAKLQLNISLFDAWIRATEIERASAGYKLD